jgi:putative DNA-invertase from lambdoid prophage Rac
MSIIFYLRVSTVDQTTDNQHQALVEAGYTPDKVFADKAVSGVTKALDRSQWKECINYLRAGDSLIVYAVDRLGRSTVDCLNTINSIEELGVRLVILKQGFDTSTPAGKLALTMFSAFAQFENELRKDRQMAGIARKRVEGGLMGRPISITPDVVAKGRDLLAQGLNKSEVARRLGINRSSVYKVIN